MARRVIGIDLEQQMTITASSGLSKDEVDRMVREAETHATEDLGRRELIEARNQADSLVYSVEKALVESRDRVPANDVQRIEAGIAAVRHAIAKDDFAAIRRATDDLQRASHALAEQLYKNAGAGSTSPPREAEVIDGEFAEVK